ncbi:MAG: hypothetical protein PUP92_29625 [Rhizonema sp. PD38]|nr:hypothetical protein [Rhizonema sp. PD38]
MGIIYIGDRATGKTHLAMELANPRSDYVSVSYPDYEYLKALLYDDGIGRTKATDAEKEVDARYLDIQVKLPTGFKQLTLDWIDTPGEIWRKTWQTDNPDKWNNFLNTLRDSEGILLIIPPYREILNPSVNQEEFMTQQQWCNRFNRWLDFLQQDCYKARHILICLNKADLFCNINQESLKLAYNPNGAQLNWQQRHSYVLQKYFRPIHPQLEKINQNISGLSVRCFITTIYNRYLLELPWLYLGAFLAK